MESTIAKLCQLDRIAPSHFYLLPIVLQTSSSMDADLSKIVDQTILNVRMTSKPSADALIATLRDFANVACSKARINWRKKDFRLESKLRSAGCGKAVRKGELRALWNNFGMDVDFVNEMLTRNCTLIIEQQRKDQRLVAKEKAVVEREMTAKCERLKREYARNYRIRGFDSLAELENIRANDMRDKKEERSRWKIRKEELKNVLVKYDAKMFTQQEELESIRDVIDREADELLYFQQAHTSQENPYNELMREKEEYQEEQRKQKLEEIRYKIATRTIVRFIEDHYPAWKKKKLKLSKKKKKYKF